MEGETNIDVFIRCEALCSKYYVVLSTMALAITLLTRPVVLSLSYPNLIPQANTIVPETCSDIEQIFMQNILHLSKVDISGQSWHGLWLLSRAKYISVDNPDMGCGYCLGLMKSLIRCSIMYNKYPGDSHKERVILFNNNRCRSRKKPILYIWCLQDQVCNRSKEISLTYNWQWISKYEDKGKVKWEEQYMHT